MTIQQIFELPDEKAVILDAPAVVNHDRLSRSPLRRPWIHFA